MTEQLSTAFPVGTTVRVASGRFADLIGHRAVVVPVPDLWIRVSGEPDKVFWRMLDPATDCPFGCTYWGAPDQLRVDPLRPEELPADRGGP